MVEFKKSQITQILPENIKNYPEIEALSYAISKALEKLIEKIKYISVYSVIDELPEKMLNLLAVELRAPYYDDKLPVEQRRVIVKNSLLWNERAGTPYAVEELISAVFGTGKIMEWFEYGGMPYHFKIHTETTITEESMKNFQEVMKRVKNVRSHMEAVEVERRCAVKIFTAGILKQTVRQCVIKEE